MRIYNSMVECVGEVERDLWEMGVKVKTKTYQDKDISDDPDMETKEIIGYSLLLTDGKDWTKSFEKLKFQDQISCEAYVEQEAYYRLNDHKPLNPSFSWARRPHVWEKFLDPTGKFSYTYPERLQDLRIPLGGAWLGINQVGAISHFHGLDPYSRQLIMSIYDQHQDNLSRGGVHRVPCTMHYQLLHRNDELTLIHNMRSCDLYTHFPIDLSISWKMVQHFALEWNVKFPRVLMQIGSLHAFQKDLKARGIF